MKKILLLVSILGFAMPCHLASAKEERVILQRSKNDALCEKVAAALNSIENEGFGDWHGTWMEDWQLITSRFALPEGENSIEWVEWEEMPLDKLEEYVASEDMRNKMRAQGRFANGVGGASIHSVEKATISLNNEFDVTFLRYHAHDPRYALERCYIQDTKPLPPLQQRDIESFNEGMIPWCNFFNYQNQLYRAWWGSGGTFVISSILHKKDGSIFGQRAPTCSFTIKPKRKKN